MATQPQTEAAKAAAAEAEARVTRRVVVSQHAVLLLPSGGVSSEGLAAAWKALGLKGAPREAAAWVVVGEFDGASKDDAIEAYAGKPGTPDAKVGTYKAPGARSWAGGARYAAPPKPLVEREAID